MIKNISTLALLLFSGLIFQQTNAQTDQRIYKIIDKVSADSIEADIRKLAGFGTRNTFSDTVSDTRGIGAARRWIKSEFDYLSKNCDNCLDVFYQKDFVTTEDGERIPHDAWVVNVVAVQKGTKYPNRYIIMSGDIDSRASNTMDFKTDAPGANDNASGMAGAMEAARVLSQYEFESSMVYVGLSGEEQGLFGGKGLAEYAKENNWEIIGVLNNDMIGNIEGVDGVIDNRTFRIFSEPVPPNETDRERTMRRFYGGEVDGISRQLARYVHKTTETYMPEMNPMMIYRLDRFGRGGHHRPFNDLGFAGIRIMEAHENYNRQHQDIRTEDGIEYGDVVEAVNFDYAEKLTAVNAINMASLAWAPPAPKNVEIGGVVEPSAKLRWDKVEGDIAGYKIYWRETTEAQWQYSRFVGNVNEFTLEGIVIDNYFFGVAAVGKDGHESVVVFPSGVFR
ncbi:M28 family metallopeptidase [Salegentibacter mishustinae]|uniref:Peptidase M28 n=1 Tax=Salegentibacter mishustinae TaxID=270918 RepID=A0A0Q9ZKB8_9FLAO|nr:M28 family metallopeptidase [Salegentibacter mishustinae]KRG30138.1 peptidase M28 [Salegentibacter mishustinae]PNW19480.1 peptidase M28 [Salegentibacter mishustinae]PZX62070.1 fibronectin type III domain protein [Salegentibacter mishustinae]GGW94717.1 peptidase M28 [Salegentibacter mishustinae]